MGGRPHSCWIFEGQDLKQRFILLLEHRNSSGQEGKGAKLGLCVMCTFQGTPTPVSVFPLQGPEHPNPGKPFTARGFPRQCYLPDNAQGRKVMFLPPPLERGPPTGARARWVAWGGPSLASGGLLATLISASIHLTAIEGGGLDLGLAEVWATPS